jgi:hypothetical protein
MLQEMGVGLEDLIAVMVAASMIGIRAEKPFVSRLEGEFLTELSEGLGWDRSQTTLALAALSSQVGEDSTAAPPKPDPTLGRLKPHNLRPKSSELLLKYDGVHWTSDPRCVDFPGLFLCNR